MATKLKIQRFRTNDLSLDSGKQFELGKSWCEDFFEIPNSEKEFIIRLIFKPLSNSQLIYSDKEIELKLSAPTARADRKAYANGEFGQSQIKEFFINNLKLQNSNLQDYFAIYKTNSNLYYLFIVPQLLYDNFVKLFTDSTLLISDEKEIKENNVFKDIQVIYYGAPGTGKSNRIKGIIDENNSIRTTFHPDSDYSTFVGCYKPIKTKVSKQEILDYDKLVEKYKEYIADLGNVTHASAIIGYNYHDSIVKMLEDGSHTIVQLVVDAYKSNTTYDTTIRSGMLLYEESQPLKSSDEKITYDFVPQAFTKAYIKAWNTEEEVYLIIEEINRGNCAQIFGDLFQLLDRKNGISEYPVDADTDLESYLSKELAKTQRVDIPQEVKEGKKLMLPSNLYVWATMNTSDQSLFPIDSAFKRRWDWVYIPIKKGDKNYKIEVGNAIYDWWEFIEIVNARIEDVTDSEDKQIGYWFAKPYKDNKISAETMVSKVIFYLWNDVFKDYAHSTSSLFHTEKRKYKFREFYNDNGDVKIELLNEFLTELGLKNETPQSEETQPTEE